MVRWLSFFAGDDIGDEYKPGRLNVVADALSRWPDYAVKTADVNRIGVESVSAPSSSLIDDVKAAYASDAVAKPLLSSASARWYRTFVLVHIVIVCTKDCCYTAQWTTM
ncbi:hypothetical protein PC128_g27037 [Phytophthora cactorum]|nr:hypothetical protein PC120_g25853 [Phytophthora cactorum]KAG3051906.1 hypothetical protein PC121_g17572 [Phytophthora cactorum]KAG3051914.1 hypothetical protein PC121_g17586 [Phytophthora cactorum]KAG3127906.1 hypothetical protein PC128_g27037 [Phytophthora cactorum]KAG4047303.1 hypothetical protein PC123_g17321 [Phytophthora cactorum]